MMQNYRANFYANMGKYLISMEDVNLQFSIDALLAMIGFLSHSPQHRSRQGLLSMA
jgi:hypothetical protein